jgi:hypothetical protein
MSAAGERTCSRTNESKVAQSVYGTNAAQLIILKCFAHNMVLGDVLETFCADSWCNKELWSSDREGSVSWNLQVCGFALQLSAVCESFSYLSQGIVRHLVFELRQSWYLRSFADTKCLVLVFTAVEGRHSAQRTSHLSLVGSWVRCRDPKYLPT